MSTTKPPVWFWAVGVLALVWNVMGVNTYIQQAYKFETAMSQLTSEQIALLDARPLWVTALFAIAVFSGVIGCVMLLLKKRFAKPFYILSFICATIQQIWWFTTSGPSISDLFMGTIMPIMIIIVCLLLIWFAKNAECKHWLS